MLASFLPVPKNLGRLILGGFFLATGIQSALGFSNFSNTIQGLNLPFPQALALIAIAIKILAGLSVTLDFHTNPGKWLLILFTSIATFLMHNPVKDSSQMMPFAKNMAIIGGLFLIE